MRFTKRASSASEGSRLIHRVYGSAIFAFSADRVAQFRNHCPDVIVGGTCNVLDNRTVEQFLGTDDYEHYDYSIYPNFDASIGFTQRGCRLKCGFCVVPKKEGHAAVAESD